METISSNDSTPIAYRKSGTGAPLVLIPMHGTVGFVEALDAHSSGA